MNITNASASAAEIQSELVIFPSRNGLKIVAYMDFIGDPGQAAGYVVMTPKYGETKKNNLQLAYYLAANGLVVLRFDHTNHVGESEGEMRHYTLPGAVMDILAAFDYLERQCGVKRAGLVASSLSCRMAIRATSLDVRISHLICLVGVVNVQSTLTTVYQEDVVSNYLDGKRWGINDVLGFEIDFEKFLGALVESNLHSLKSTCDDLAAVRVPVSFLSAQNDAWVNIDDVRHAVEFAKAGRLHPIKDSMHEVRENPEAAERTFRHLVAQCMEHARGEEVGFDQLVIPPKRSFIQQNKIERERLRRANPVQQNEVDFWSQYLSKYEFFESVDVYQYYINLVGDLFGEFRSGELVLDAGCGNGLFGVWAIRHLLENTSLRLDMPVIYTGLDLTHDGLLDAMGKHSLAIRRGAPSKGEAKNNVSSLYGRVDLDHLGRSTGDDGDPVLRFADNTFDKICCSLLISYLKRPADLVRHLYRVLRPGGTLVISSMKPFCDLSEIYRRYAERNPTDKEIESARDLLRAAGKIKVKEEQGVYTFFSAEELQEMLLEAGFKAPQIFSSFGNQANVLRAVK
ncbi:MAG: methyltransferase domain-containing protein [Verrucomicrobia bacterium]|nr:methyltransferase domain-containing protein [Verrucomicrobiota bacterium]